MSSTGRVSCPFIGKLHVWVLKEIVFPNGECGGTTYVCSKCGTSGYVIPVMA